MVAHTCNPSTLEGPGGQITWGQVFETRLGNMTKTCLYKKEKLAGLGGARQAQLVPATWDAEVGEWLVPGRQMLQ